MALPQKPGGRESVAALSAVLGVMTVNIATIPQPLIFRPIKSSLDWTAWPHLHWIGTPISSETGNSIRTPHPVRRTGSKLRSSLGSLAAVTQFVQGRFFFILPLKNKVRIVYSGVLYAIKYKIVNKYMRE